MKKALVCFLVGLLAVLSFPILAQQVIPNVQTAQGEFLGKSRPLTELEPYTPSPTSQKEKARAIVPKGVPNFTDRVPMPSPYAATAKPKNGDPLVQQGNNLNMNFIVEPQTVFDGIDETRAAGIFPPDPSGVANSEYYLQTTNTSGGTYMVVFDLEGNEVFSLDNLNALWSEFNATGFGDPIVLWDQEAERWFIAEFQDFGSSALLIAVSETSDPTGSWYAHRFQTVTFPDYPKYGVWPDAYYITTNEFDSEVPVYVIDRQAMLNGLEADMQILGIPKFADENGDAFQVATPVDWDGSIAPPDGNPGYVVRMYDDAWDGGEDKVELWEIDVDWDNPSNSMVNGPTELFTEPFDAQLCEFGIFDCLPHPNGQIVSALQHVIMHRVPYNNFGTHESIVLQFAVDVESSVNRAGIRWMELRRSGEESWSIYQEGTYSVDDGNSRFMGSIAMDRQGNILLGYTVGGEQNFSLAYTGRLASDPLGTMTINEYQFADGLSGGLSQRWGDYAAMTVNPQNGTDFWFTGEYMLSGEWGTKIMMARINRDTNDVGPQTIITPQNSGYLTDSEVLQVEVRNYGYNPQSNIDISYTVNGSPTVTETITATIPADSTYLHTFVPTVDMSTIGEYDFTIYTSLAADTTYFNDTLRRVVRQLTRNDVGAIGTEGLLDVICETELNIDAVIRNFGVDTLYSAVVTYQLNGGTPTEINWEGTLAPGASTTIPIFISPFIAGTNTLSISASLPNGLPDEDNANDVFSRSFEAILNGETAVLELLTDDYPTETTWELQDLNGLVIAEGGGYTDILTLYTETFCLDPEACYVFYMYDSFGDGICCSYGEGNYRIINPDGEVLLASDGVFGSVEITEFCADPQCLLTIDAVVDPESSPGANDGRIIFTVENGVPSYTYSIDGGANFQASPIFFNLPPGDYDLVAVDGAGCEATAMVTILACTLEGMATVVSSEPNEPTGSITIEAAGGSGNYEYSIDGVNYQAENVFGDLPPGDFIVTIRDGVGCELTIEVSVDVINAQQEATLYGQYVTLYPNPTDGFVQVEVVGTDVSQLPVEIYSADGKVVRYAQLANFGGVQRGTISLYGLPAGTYHLRFVGAGLPRLYAVVKK